MSDNVDAMSNCELLSMIVGAKLAEEWVKEIGCLSTLLYHPPTPGDRRRQKARLKLLAAKEIVRRALLEPMSRGNALNSPASVRDYLRLSLAGLEHEVFMVLFLDAQNRVIKAEEMFRGTLTQTSVYPREVVKRSLYYNAGATIFAHNHPSGVAEPSHADETLTHALKNALNIIDVRVLDHFIIAANSVTSFAERGLL